MREENGILALKLREAFLAENEALIAGAMQQLQKAGAPVYSEKHLQRIEELKQLGRKKERQYFYFGARAASRAAILAAALLTGMVGGVSAYGINQLRTPKIQLSQEGILLYYDLTDEELATLPERIEVCYAPTWVPKGYELEKESVSRMAYVVIYEKEEQSIMLMQNTITQTLSTFDTEGVVIEKRKVHGYNAYYFVQKNYANLIWCDGEYQYFLSIPEKEKDSIVKIAESLKERKAE